LILDIKGWERQELPLNPKWIAFLWMSMVDVFGLQPGFLAEVLYHLPRVCQGRTGVSILFTPKQACDNSSTGLLPQTLLWLTTGVVLQRAKIWQHPPSINK
jgi:hypothetical protein